MDRRFFLFGLILLAFVSLASAEPCSDVGFVDYDNNQYCDSDLQYKPLKINEAVCLNDYECTNQSCIDGLCQSKYVDLYNQSLMDKIVCEFIGERCCDPVDQNYICVGREAFLCGNLGILESKGEIAGQCGVSSGGGNNGGGGGGRCNPSWSCSSWTRIVNGTWCGERTCSDSRNCGTNLGKPATQLNCPSVLNENSYCGDNVCDIDETSYSCALDCGTISICGNNVCDDDESSSSCPADCKPVREKSYFWIFVLLIILLLLAIGIVLFLIFRRIYENKEISDRSGEQMPKSPPSPPASPPSAPVNKVVKTLPQNNFNIPARRVPAQQIKSLK